MLLLAEGDLIAGEYEIFAIAAGGMGAVYFCKDSKGKTVALKTYLENEENIEVLRSRFIEEVSAWINIHRGHYLLSFEELIFYKSKPFIKMQFCEKGSLRKYVGRLDEKTAVTYFIQICLGLRELSERYGYVHLDIKPDNILIADDGEILICDLGIAKIYKDQLGRKLISTAGSIPYMAPEQLSARPVDLRTDMYAAGMIFYEMLTGKCLFEGNTLEEISRNKFSRNYSNIHAVKSEYKEVIEFLTHPNINNRPKDYNDLLKIIDTFIKPDGCAKKLPFYKNDNRLPISNDGIIYFWMQMFPTRIAEGTFIVKMTCQALIDIDKAATFHKLGKHVEAIQCCDRLLQSGDGYTNFDAYILKSVEIEKNPLNDVTKNHIKKYECVEFDSLMSYDALEQLFISAVAYIETGGNDHAAIAVINKYTDRSLQCKNLPEKFLTLLAQILVKTKRYSEANQILITLIKSKSVLVRFKSYATLAVSLFETKKFDDLVVLINEKIYPETNEYNTHLAQRVCGQTLIFINNHELGANHLYKAYLLESTDLWSLKSSIIGFLNANKIDTAKKLFQVMFEQDSNSTYTKQVISVFKQAKLIS